MANLQAAAGWPEDFCGIVRLFPLPNLVLFPNVVQPLHIFEPRYCEMLLDSLQNDRLIAMALLQPGWEHQYQNRPPIASTVCVGKIVSHTPTNDGRHNILLVGLKRARIIEEIEPSRAFRQARVEIQTDIYPPEDACTRKSMTDSLQDVFRQLVPEGLAAQSSFQQLAGQPFPLGTLTDTIAYALNLPLAVKQQLLAEPNVDIRCRILLRCLKQKIESAKGPSSSSASEEFPPPFSEN
jgi:ATP-dependent Lon protease